MLTENCILAYLLNVLSMPSRRPRGMVSASKLLRICEYGSTGCALRCDIGVMMHCPGIKVH